MSWNPFTVIKSLLIKESGTLTPKQIEIVPGGTANTKTTLVGSQTTDKTVTLPDATDTLVGKATTDVLTNKTLTGNTAANLVNGSGTLAINSTGTVTLPNATDTLVGKATVDTLTNKSIDADTNTITNIENADIKAAAAIDATKIADGTVTNTEFQYLNSVTSNVQTQIDSKQPTGNYLTALTGDVTASGPGSAVATISGLDVTKIGSGTVDNTEFGYLNGTTSNIQSQLNSITGSGVTSLTGDVTGTGPGAAATTIANGAITNAKVNASAAIAYSKLNLAGSIVNADIATGANISVTKLLAQTADKAAITDPDGHFATSVTTSEEVSYLSGVTSAIQTQLDAKAPSSTAVTLTGSQTLTNKTLTAPVINSPTGLVKADVGLSNVDNTSDATKNAAVATLTNKTLTSPTINNPAGLTKTDVGLSNVDNTSDATKNAAAVTLTNKTLTAPIISTISNTGTLTLPTSTDTLVGRATTDTLTNKTLTSPTVNTATLTSPTSDNVIFQGQASTPANPSINNYKMYVTTAGSVQLVDSSGSVTPVGSSTGSGVQNFITNADAATNTSGWSTYKDAAQAYPVDGTGGVPNVTWTRNTSNPLNGTAEFQFTKDAANRQGEGVSSNFSVPIAYAGSVVSLKLNYRKISGTFNAGTSSTDSDLTFWIVDVNTLQLYQPSSYKLLASSTIADQFQAEWQVPVGNYDYRLCIHVGTTNASAFVVAFDDIFITPSQYAFGTPISDWTPYTPTFTGFGTATSIECFSRRVGSNQEIRGKFVAGTSTAVEARISLNAVTSASSTIIPTITTVGEFRRGATASNMMSVLIEPSVGYITLSSNTIATNPLTKANGNVVLSTGETGSFYASIPVAGWSSSVQMADQTSTRVVDFAGYSPAGGSVLTTANTTPMTATSLKDTHAAWNGSTYTIPVPGDYLLSITAIANAAGTLSVYVDGVIYKKLNSVNNNVAWNSATAMLQNMTVGQTVQIRCDSSLTLTGSATVSAASHLNISRLSGPSQIASSETVAASYWVSANFAASATVPINFDSKDYDTHNAVTTSSTAWKFTAPIGGLYTISGVWDNTTASTWMAVYKNGSKYKNISYDNTAIGATFSNSIMLNAGEYIDFRPTSSVTVSGGALSGDGTANITIIRAGNRG